MQILGVAGRSGAGKTTLCQTLAEAVVESGYGIPRLLHFAGPDLPSQVNPVEAGIVEIHKALLQAQEDDKDSVLRRGEIMVMIDDLHYLEEVDLLRAWGAIIIFLDADNRMSDRKALWKDIPNDRMANAYSDGILPETFFDWHITNFRDIDTFKLECQMGMQYWLGGVVGDI